MPTTSNFGWNTPADTDLVKDGAAAIRTLGNNIDASLVDLKGGTTGQILSKASNTDLDFTWTSDATGIQATIFDAKGDLIAASAADTAAKLASSGVNGDVLTVDTSTATGLKWAAPASGGMTSIASGSLSSSTVTISSIVGTYRNLVLVIRDAFVSAPGNELSLRINGDSSSNYRYSVMRGGITTLSNGTGQSLFRCAGGTTNLPTSATAVSYIIQLNEYANATYHPISVLWNHNGGDNGFTIGQQDTITAAITSLTILPHAGATFSAGTYVLYGVK